MSESVTEQITQAEAYKEEGNKRFKEGNFRKALGAYHKVFCFVNGLSEPQSGKSSGSDAGAGDENQAMAGMVAQSSSNNQIPKERVADVRKLKQSTRLNMAACYVKVEEYQKCVDACTKALEFGQSSKAHFRRGQAYVHLRNFEGAKTDLERARELEPADPAILQELRRLKPHFAEADKKERRVCAKMFSGGGPSDPRSARSDPEPKAEELPPADAAEGGPMEVDQDAAAGAAAEASAVSAASPAEQPPPVDMAARDEARKPEVNVRELQYSWEQQDDHVKIYVSFDQCEELAGGVDESRVETEFGEWSILLVIRNKEESGKPPLGLRLGDFHRRIQPDKCKCTVRDSRITLRLEKRVKEHWWNLLQHVG